MVPHRREHHVASARSIAARSASCPVLRPYHVPSCAATSSSTSSRTASSDDTFVVHDDGYRVREVTYRQLADTARVFASRLTAASIHEADNVVIWSQNRTEWLIAFWGCVLARVVVVPVDFRTSENLLHRIAEIVEAKAILVGDEVKATRLRPIARFAPSARLCHTCQDGRTADLSKDDLIDVQGTVVAVHSGGLYRVQVDSGHEVLAQLSGRMRRFRIKVVPGDRVTVGVSPYDPVRGIITFRAR
jgi:translation initiation factor IF-1